jgi:sphingomyelin phosphodiesterase acid-like 3
MKLWVIFYLIYGRAVPSGGSKVRSEEGLMSRWPRYSLSVILCSVLWMAGCAGVSGGSKSAPTPTPASYQIVTVSDLHFNPLYDSSLYTQLVNADPATQWAGIYLKSSVKIPSAGGADTNYLLLALTLKSMQQNIKNSPVVLFTGDLLGHNIPHNFCNLYYASLSQSVPPNCATSPDPTTAGPAMQTFINNTFTFVATQIRQYVGNVPVIYVPGNIDAYLGSIGPDSTFLANNAATVYSQFLNSAFDQQAFQNTFTADGYYSVAPLGANLLVIGLNSNSFIAGQTNYSTGNAELTWLDSQLSSAQAAGQKVWILMHVPPGAYDQYIAQVAAVPSDVDASDALMMWDSGVQSTFMSTLQKYPGVVTMMLAGHTHMDEFRILPTGDVLEQLPGISPCFGNNPAYKVLTITQNTFTPTDYQSFDYDLALLPPPSQFGPLYQFSSTYGLQGSLGNSLQQLYPGVVSNQNMQNTYTLMYSSGSQSVNPITLSPWNPINEVNWPIFACTIGDMDQADYVKCVNSY